MASALASTPAAAGPSGDGARRSLPVVGALALVYVVWGSTYLAMRIALKAWPPFLMGGVRFSIAGSVLFAILRARGAPTPSLRGWGSAAVVGVLLLALGNGFVAVAQRAGIDSGVAATVVATMPTWLALLAAAFGDRPTRREIVGLGLGFVGVAVLQSGGELHAGWGLGAMLGAPIAWALGSVLARRLPLPPGLMGTAATMIAGGAAMLLLAAALGQTTLPPLATASTLAVGYLVVFGSILAFSAYGFLLRATRPAVASSYAYVNPVVALALGSVFGDERLTVGKLLACGVIIAGVVVATRPARARP